jgi:hypothetical protein
MEYFSRTDPVGLGLELRALPDLRAIDPFVEAAVDAGVRLVDVGDAADPGIARLFRRMRRFTDLCVLVRLGDLRGTTMTAALEEIRRALAVDRLDYCFIRAEDASATGGLREHGETDVVNTWGVWDPPPEFLPEWTSGVGAAVSIGCDILTVDGLHPYLSSAVGRPVFLRWDGRLPSESGAMSTSTRAAAEAAGLSLRSLGLGIPLYTPGVSAVLLSAENPEETIDVIRGATSLNPESLLMREFLDSWNSETQPC